MKKRLCSALELFESVPMINRADATLRDLADFVDELREQITARNEEPKRVGATQLAIWALADCATAATSDADAELIRRGFCLAMCVANVERKKYQRGVMRRVDAQKNKTDNFSAQRKKIAARFQLLEPSVGSLEARKKLQREHKFKSLKTVNNALDREAVAY